MTTLVPSTTAIAWSGGNVVRPLDRGAAVERLPGSVELDPFERLAMAFLVGYTASSARAYLADLKAWGAACVQLGTHPFDARRHHVDAWVRMLSAELLARTNKPMAPASIARRLSAVSAFYDYGISVDVLDFSPVANVRRPKVSEDSTTVGLSAEEAVTLLDAADAHSPRLGALVSLLTYNGVRIDEALAADVSDYTYQRGHRVLRIVRKGGRAATAPLNPITVRALDAYMADNHPTSGPLFLDRTKCKRLAYTTAYEMIQRLARKAGIPAAESITPHSFRHTFIISPALTG